MPEIEDRLCTALMTMADEVPTSVHARAELDRRLARGRNRRVPAWAVTAAAVVVVAGAVAVPVVLNRDQPPSGLGQGAAPPELTTSPPESVNPADLAWPGHITTPRILVTHGDRESPDFRELTVSLTDDYELCFRVLGGSETPVGVEPLCEPFPDLGPGHLVETRSLHDLDLPMPTGLRNEATDHLLFLLAPEVSHLVVRGGDGAEVPPMMGFEGGVWGFAVSDFDGQYEGFGYTAYDIDGNVIEEAIT
jgi:hypothetical protein